MRGTIFFTSLGLLFVLEGILPFLSPRAWRRVMQQMFIQSDRSVRITGLVSMLIGLIIVYIVRDFY